MKKTSFLFAISLLIFSCTKMDSNSSQGGANSNYNFSDLLPTENLVDSIIVFHKIGTPGIFKFYYANKTTIKSIFRNDSFEKERDTLFYTNNLDSIRTVNENIFGLFTSTIKFQYLNGLKSRAYYYDDNYIIPIQRQLGSYISYTGNNPTSIQYKYIEPSSFGRDSIKIIIKRKSNGDIDSVFNQQSAFPGGQNGLMLTFEYGSTINKLNQNANLKNLRYSYDYSPIEFDFNNIDTYWSTVLDYEFMNDIFYDIIFNNTTLPSKFYYWDSGSVPFYLKYLFNANNYVTSISIGSSPNFNQIVNERIQIKYH